MLETVGFGEDGKVVIATTVNRLAIYLDTHSIINLAKADRNLRERATELFRTGADLLFSTTHAAELARLRGRSSAIVKAFLDELGPRWIPVDGNGLASVLDLEQEAPSDRSVCVARSFLERFFAARSIQLHGEQPIELVSPAYFTLSTVMDWLEPQRSEIDAALARFDAQLRLKLEQLAAAATGNPARAAAQLSMTDFDSRYPAQFAWQGLLRSLIGESKSHAFKKGDGADLCHAVIALAYAHFATLDTTWKRRAALLPRPNGLASVYGPNELSELVRDAEVALAP